MGGSPRVGEDGTQLAGHNCGGLRKRVTGSVCVGVTCRRSTVSLMKTNKAGGAASRASGAAATGVNVARDRARDAADLARERARDGAIVARGRARDAAAQYVPVARERARDAAAQYVPVARDAAAQAAHAAQQGVGHGVHDAREWAAPLIEDAANAVTDTVAPKVSAAVTDTVAPKVSAALKATARRVDPTPPAKRRLLGWPGAVILGVLAVAGVAAAVLLRKRQPAPPPPYPDEEGDGTTASSTAAAGLAAEANGRVRQS